MNIALRAAVFVVGALIVIGTVRSTVRTLVLPRGVSVWLARTVGVLVRYAFATRCKFAATYEKKDRILAALGPSIVIGLAAAWLGLVFIGYTLMYWAIDDASVGLAIRESGSALFTLGFATPVGISGAALVFTEAAIGLGLLALLIAYLPVLYSAFSVREEAVATISVRAGSPPAGWQMLQRFHAIEKWDGLNEVWRHWEVWFAEIEESHTTFSVLPFFRSPQPNRSWLTASGSVLDAAAILVSAVDVPWDAEAQICIRSGYLALRSIADIFHIPYNSDPAPDDPISIERREFDEVCKKLADAGIPMMPDRDQAWKDFAGWRVNYDQVLIALCGLVTAPPAPWSSDRSSPVIPPLVLTPRSRRRIAEWAERPLKK